ncbi:MAG: hypothetical protein J6L69_06575 [Lachnospiraceae bacterium]|nr:hypothetical protein [Lachnospiraceae bacterium]
MMKVNKKCVIICGLIVLVLIVSILVWVLQRSNDSDNGDSAASTDEMLIEQFFDIENKQYEILDVWNNLDEKEYGGSYRVLLRVQEEDIQDFRDEVEEHYFQEKDGKGDPFYTNLSSVKRNIPSAKWIPKTCNFFIYILSNEDGSYNVDMKYTE